MAIEPTRRSFIKAAAGTAAAGMVAGTAIAVAEETAYTYADTIAWDGEFDVVVVGFGAAGAMAAKAASDSGASVLLLEKAPYGFAGGNSRFCGQGFQYGENGYDAILDYHRAMAGPYDYDEEVLKVYCEGMADARNFLIDELGVDPDDVKPYASKKPEYPELAEEGTAYMITFKGATGRQGLWRNLRQQIADRADTIDLWCDAPAKHLIQDPISKTIIGVVVDKQGTLVNVRAKNGVVMTCGGFEANAQMQQDYLHVARMSPIGSHYNTGDGISMCLEVGADLWHMANFESLSICGGVGLPCEPTHPNNLFSGKSLQSGSIFLAGGDGQRFIKEDASNRHGHAPLCGEWHVPILPYYMSFVFDQAQYDDMMAAGWLDDLRESFVVKADTIEQLAEACEGMDPAILADSVRKFNYFAEIGEDMAFGRAPESLRAFSAQGPYYALPVQQMILNTQGGPRRNADAQIVAVDGTPIPNLYSAGEFGGVNVNYYNAGGNVAECLIFGRIAGRNAAQPKDPLPAFALPVVESTPAMTVEADYVETPVPEYVLADNEYVGTTSLCKGNIMTVKVTMDGDKIADISFLEIHESVTVCEPAIVQVPAAIIAAQSTDVEIVAGCSYTSEGIIDAVNNALAQVK